MSKVFLMRSLLFAFILVSLLVPALSFSAETSLALDSMAGDFIGGGNFYFYPQDAGVFAAQTLASNVVSLSFQTPGYDHIWHLYFAAPNNALLTVGTYQGATRHPFLLADGPGMSISGEGRGCNSVSGSFEVKEISRGPNSEVLTFWATFEQHCENGLPALRGEVRYNAAAPNSVTTLKVSANPSVEGQSVAFTARVAGLGGNPTGAVTFKDGVTVLGTSALLGNPSTATLIAANLVDDIHSITAEYSGDSTFETSASGVLRQKVEKRNATALVLGGDAGEALSNGNFYHFTLADAVFVTSSDYYGRVSLFVDSHEGAHWNLNFGAPNENLLAVGKYQGAISSPTDSAPWLQITGNGMACMNSKGSFEVKEITYGPNKEILSFWANFEQHCENAKPALWGEVRYNASISDTNTTITSSSNPSVFGQVVTFTAQVSSQEGTPTGTVTFKDGSAILGSSTLSGTPATATLETAGLASGTHPVKAVYSGDGIIPASESFAVYQVVKCSLNLVLLPASAMVSAQGGALEIDVQASSCAWDVLPDVAWITLVSPATGTNNGRITLSIAANEAATPRTGTVRVGGRVFSVLQSGKWQKFGLESLEGGDSSALGVSGNGSVVVGYSDVLDSNGYRAFAWTKPGSIANLGTLPGMQHSSANGVSSDGKVIVGGAFSGNAYGRAFRWTQASGMVDLGLLPGVPYAEAYAASADGSVVAGVATDNDTLFKAFRWTAEQGMIDVGAPNYAISEATGISADGNTIVGGLINQAGNVRAFRWSTTGGMTELGTLGGSVSFATGVSGDGTVIVGFAENSVGQTRAFRWTAASGMIDLGSLYGWPNSAATGISADGSVVVGSANVGDSDTAFRWTQATGMQAISQWLTSNGLDVASDSFSSANAASTNGNTIVGDLQSGNVFVVSVSTDMRALTASARGTGSGELTSTTGGVTCNTSVCTGSFAQDATVLITANAAPGSTFAGWEGCSSVNGNQCAIMVNAWKTVTAVFTMNQYALTAHAEGNRAGVVSSTPSGIRYSYPTLNSGTGTFAHGTVVNVSASVPQSSTTVWTGCDSTTGNSTEAICIVTMNAPKDVTATFTYCAMPGVPVMSDPGLSVRSGSVYTVRWTAAAGANSYEVCEATNSGFVGATCTTVSGTSQNFTHTVGSNTVYYYRVRSKNTCGSASAFSATNADMAVYVDAEPDVRASVTCPASVKGGNSLDVAVTLANNTCSAPFSFSTGRVMLLGNADGTLSGFGVYGPFSRTISPEAVVNGANCAAMPLAPATSPAKTLRVHDAVPAGLIGSTAQVMVELISSNDSVVVSGECMVPVVP